MRTERWIVCALSFALAACSTSPVSLTDAKLVPPERQYAFITPSTGDGTAAVIRDSGILGHGCGIDIFVDSKKAATLAAGEKVMLAIPTGEHILSAAPTGKGLCGIGDAKHAARDDLKISITADHVTTFRYGMMGLTQTSL